MDFDREIAAMRVEYDISGYQTQRIDLLRKVLETKRALANHESSIAELDKKICEKKAEYAKLVDG